MQAAEFLDSILKKKWLSSNTVREGLIACFTLTLSNYAKQAPLSRLGLEMGPDENTIYTKVVQTAQEGFRAMKIDDEYPTKEQILELKALMEERLGFAKLKENGPAHLEEYRHLTQALLAKME